MTHPLPSKKRMKLYFELRKLGVKPKTADKFLNKHSKRFKIKKVKSIKWLNNPQGR